MQEAKCAARIVMNRVTERRVARRRFYISQFPREKFPRVAMPMKRRQRQLRDAWHSVTEEIFTLQE